jgi:predicted HAD superfamily Cof-like phosphohydrolase
MNTWNEVKDNRDYARFLIDRTDHQQRVDEFMVRADQSVRLRPVTQEWFASMESFEERKLRAKLILEEAFEQVKDLGLDVGLIIEGEAILKYANGAIEINLRESDTVGNLVGFVDNCCDQSVVSIGSLSQFGVPDEPFLRIVDGANLRKFGEGGYRRADGKWIKPPDFVGPEKDIETLLEKCRHRLI